MPRRSRAWRARSSVLRALTTLALGGALTSALGAPAAATGAASPLTRPAFDSRAWDTAALGGLTRPVFQLGLTAASCAVRAGVVSSPPTLTVIDYSRPSTAKRLWVFDLRRHLLLYQELVSHGQGSGGNLPTLFSNRPESHESSLGLFLTGDPYVGENGYSLRLDGLEPGINDHARARDIVIHGAPYVSTAFARAHGRLGRSWGCPAVRPAVARQIIDRVKGGSLVFAYSNDARWLQSSPYLGQCTAAQGAVQEILASIRARLGTGGTTAASGGA